MRYTNSWVWQCGKERETENTVKHAGCEKEEEDEWLEEVTEGR